MEPLVNYNDPEKGAYYLQSLKSGQEVAFDPGDFVIFGPETRGLPESIRNELGEDCLLRIAMLPDSRSLNLANAAAVVVYEAWRQLDFAGGR